MCPAVAGAPAGAGVPICHTSPLAGVDEAHRPGGFFAKHRTNERARRRLGRIGQARQPLDHQRGGDSAKLGIISHFEKPGICQRSIERVVARKQRRIVDGGALPWPQHGIERIEDNALILGEGKIHQRGSLGSWRTSLAMMLSWISAAPAAIPATIPRWWCILR